MHVDTSLDTKSSSFAYGYKHLREAPTGNTIVTGNPDLGYFGLSAGTGTKNWKCGRAPENVWKYICDKKHYSWNHKKTPTFVTLGINGSYYLAFEGGAGCYAYDKHYPTLAGILARESSAKGGGAKVLVSLEGTRIDFRFELCLSIVSIYLSIHTSAINTYSCWTMETYILKWLNPYRRMWQGP